MVHCDVGGFEGCWVGELERKGVGGSWQGLLTVLLVIRFRRAALFKRTITVPRRYFKFINVPLRCSCTSQLLSCVVGFQGFTVLLVGMVQVFSSRGAVFWRFVNVFISNVCFWDSQTHSYNFFVPYLKFTAVCTARVWILLDLQLYLWVSKVCNCICACLLEVYCCTILVGIPSS